MPRPYDAVVAGYVGVDLTPTFLPPAEGASLAQLLRPGKLTEVGPLEMTAGGVVANAGLAMAALGNRVALMGLVGTDPLGELLEGLLQGRAEVMLRRTNAPPTAYGLVLAPPGTDRMFLECPGCNATFTSADLDYETIAQARVFHFGYPPLMPALLADDGADLAAMFRRARALGVTTSLDMTLPDPEGPAGQVDWRALLANVLPHVDIFAPSVEELLYMLAPEGWAELAAEAADRDLVDVIPESLYSDLAAEAIALGAAVVLIKAGHRGGYCRTAEVAFAKGWSDREVRVPAFAADPARVRNACGAGDAAVAGFLTGMLRGESLEVACRGAMLAGRDSLYGPDGATGVRPWNAMLAEEGEA